MRAPRRSRAPRPVRREIAPELRKQFSYPNVMQTPRLVKVVVNMGVGEAPATPSSSTARSAT